MKIALEVWSADYERIVRCCQMAEQVGLDAFYYGESPHGLNLDCWTTLAGLAQTTSTIRLGPVITNVLPSYRSTLLLARQAATVNQISNGRVDFRTGVGAAAEFGRPWWESRGISYPDYDERLADLSAALTTLPTLWNDGEDLGGEATASVPITIAATGRRAMALAATHATTWETSFRTPEEFRAVDSVVAQLEDAHDRLPPARTQPLTRSLEIDGFIGSSEGRVGDLLARLAIDRGNEEDLAPILERALVGTARPVADKLRSLGDAGVDQVVVALHDPLDLDAVQTLGEAALLLRH